MSLILALDQGTSSSRSILFDAESRVVASSRREFRQIFPKPGWVEHNPEEIWDTQLATARQVITESNLTARDISAAGITNQRETTIVWERANGRPVYNAIVWQDRRTTPQIEKLIAGGHEPLVREKTGLLLDPYFSATKIAWILDNIQGARKKAEKGELAFGTIDCWLLYNLSGGAVHTTDVTNASRTLLYDITRLCWDAELLELFGVPVSMLPEVRPSIGFFCETGRLIPGTLIPITGVAGDQQAALLGQMCIHEGMAKNTYGTGCFIMANTGEKPVIGRERLLATVAWQQGKEKPLYALEGSIFTAGAAIQWLRDGLKIISTTSEINTLASSVADSGGVVVVPAFAGLGAPHWDPGARGTILGITRGTTAAHIARATLEGIAFQVAEIIEVMTAGTGKRVTALRVDGGASASDPLMQIQADLLGIAVCRPAMKETTALGAACCAALGKGVFKDITHIAKQWKAESIFEPSMPEDQRTTLMMRWKRAVERSKQWE